VRHAEALLLVDDEEPEVLEVHVLRQEPVRPDDDVALAVLHLGEHLLQLALRLEAAHRVDGERVVFHPRLEDAKVLLREDRRRAQEGHLLAGHGDAVRRAERHLRLAEADVAAHEAVHRAIGFEVVVHVVDRARLIRGLLEGERRLEGAVVVVGARDGVTRAGPCARRRDEGARRPFADGLFDARLGLREGRAAEAIDLRLRALTARVLLDLVQPIDGR
jgi:hypothetical protein